MPRAAPVREGDSALVRVLQAYIETLRAQRDAGERQEAQNDDHIGAELREIAGKASAELFRASRRSRKSAHAHGGGGSAQALVEGV